MKHEELVDQVSASIFNGSGIIERLKSLIAIRNYLEKLDEIQLMTMLKNK